MPVLFCRVPFLCYLFICTAGVWVKSANINVVNQHHAGFCQFAHIWKQKNVIYFFPSWSTKWKVICISVTSAAVFPLILLANSVICGKWKMCFSFCASSNTSNLHQKHGHIYQSWAPSALAETVPTPLSYIPCRVCHCLTYKYFFSLRMRWEYRSQLNKKTHLKRLKTASDFSTRCLHILAHKGPLTETRSFSRWATHGVPVRWSSPTPGVTASICGFSPGAVWQLSQAKANGDWAGDWEWG